MFIFERKRHNSSWTKCLEYGTTVKIDAFRLVGFNNHPSSWPKMTKDTDMQYIIHAISNLVL